MKTYIMRKDLAVAVAVTGILAAAALSSRAADDSPVALAKVLPEASVSLDQGLKAKGSQSQASVRSKTAPSSYRSIR